jgi:hypothetical protein
MARRFQALCGIAHHDDAVSHPRLTGEAYWRNAPFYGKLSLNKEFAMLTKAILTGGVLSALAGSIVYFGTEGADAQTLLSQNDVRVEDTELAGAPDAAVSELAEAAAPSEVSTEANASEVMAQETKAVAGSKMPESKMPESKMAEAASPAQDAQDTSEPKTKWLDQYLKRTMPKSQSDSEMESADTMTDRETVEPEMETTETDVEIEILEDDAGEAAGSDKVKIMRMRMEKHMKRNAMRRGDRDSAMSEEAAEAKSHTMTSGDQEEETLTHRSVDIKSLDLETLESLDLDGEIDVEILKQQLGMDGKDNVQIRIVKKKMDMSKSKDKMAKKTRKKRPVIAYDTVLAEAKKLLVVDMRNQAVLEIIDYAIDNGDMTEATDLLNELSTPELRDTARARIGTNLAKRGKSDAAFAVLESLEIDELSAPIRLEIITAMMATKQERKAAKTLR